MAAAGISPGIASYRALVTACRKCAQWELAIAVLQEMQVNGRVRPDHVAYKDAIAVCCAALQWGLAVELLQEMPIVGLSPEPASYDSCIKACNAVGQFELAVGLIRQMAQAELRANVASFNAILKACSKRKQWKIAAGLLREMTQLGVPPDASSYKAAIAACGWARPRRVKLQVRRGRVPKDPAGGEGAEAPPRGPGKWGGARPAHLQPCRRLSPFRAVRPAVARDAGGIQREARPANVQGRSESVRGLLSVEAGGPDPAGHGGGERFARCRQLHARHQGLRGPRVGARRRPAA